MVSGTDRECSERQVTIFGLDYVERGLRRPRRERYRRSGALGRLPPMRILAIAIAFSTGALLADTAAADSMRCGKWIVSESASLEELRGKCGEPRDKEVTNEDAMATNPNGARYKVGTVVRERWTYQASPRSLPMAVYIVDGKIIRIERAK
jgi:hypothetical protein